MSANIEELTTKYTRLRGAAVYTCHEAIRGALTEQAEAFKGELQAYDGMVRELTKTAEDMQAAQSVPVVGEAVAYVRAKKLNVLPPGGLVNCYLYDPSSIDEYDCDDLVAVFREPTHSIPAAELATLRKDAERYRWLREQSWDAGELCIVSQPKHAVKLGYDCPSLFRLDAAIDAAIAQGKGE